MLAALTLVATMLIQIPLPVTGYVHPGDCLVMLCGFLLGPVWGAGAAGIGSMLADILSGYAVYAIPTLIIKALSAFVAAVVFRALRDKFNKKVSILPALIAGICASLPIVLGYWLCEWVMIGDFRAALVGVPGNIMQGLFGTMSSTVLIVLMEQSAALRRFLQQLD